VQPGYIDCGAAAAAYSDAMAALDPRLVELYDQDNPDGPDHDYFRALADRLDARTIVDLGCGTGSLTVTLARGGRYVVGVDPDEAMLGFARSRPGGEGVHWVHGDSRSITAAAVDLVVMSGNVAQAIVGEAWARTLSDVFLALRPGGILAFESRNPAVRAWERWTRQHTYGARETGSGPLVEWMEVTGISVDGTVVIEAHNIFEATNEHLVYTDRLAFRSRHQIESDLASAGLLALNVWGGWRQEPFSPTSPQLVLEAVRPARSAR
jgi:SAM-dependent methyltransferase